MALKTDSAMLEEVQTAISLCLAGKDAMFEGKRVRAEDLDKLLAAETFYRSRVNRAAGRGFTRNTAIKRR